MKTNVQNYIDFLEWKESPIKKYIFSPRIDNALENWIHKHLLRKKIKDYNYNNPEHKEISNNCWIESEKVMISMESIIDYISNEKINPFSFKWFWKKSYQEFIEKIKSL